MHVAQHHSLNELQALQDHADKPALVLKLRAIILARQGWIASHIAQALGKSSRTIQQWVSLYNHQSIEGLIDRRSSNHRYLTADQEQQLTQYLDAQADDPHAGVRHADELGTYIKQQFGVTYSLSGLYELLHRLGYVWLMPRPRHEKNDPAIVDAFKKTPLRLWNKSRVNIRIKKSKSGSKTKHALASKAR